MAPRLVLASPASSAASAIRERRARSPALRAVSPARLGGAAPARAIAPSFARRRPRLLLLPRRGSSPPPAPRASPPEDEDRFPRLPGEEDDAAADDDDAPPPGMSREAADLLNLLVLTGGVKGSLAVVLGALVGINSLSSIHPDLPSTQHGLLFAAPVALADLIVMLPRWGGAPDEKKATDKNPSSSSSSFGSKTRRALTKYQREEALSNPCRSMPAWQDALVAAVARLTEEMLERAVVLGFIAAWVADRAVEAGAEPYDVEAPARWVAVAAAAAYLEIRLRRDAARRKSAVRAFRVERGPDGKQKMIPMDEEEIEATMMGMKMKKKKKGGGAEEGGGLPLPGALLRRRRRKKGKGSFRIPPALPW